MKIDGPTIEVLYSKGILKDSDIKKINIINAIEVGQKIKQISSRFNLSNAYVSKVKRHIKS